MSDAQLFRDIGLALSGPFIAAASAAVGAYFGSLFSRSAEHRADDDWRDAIDKKLERSTKIVERTKSLIDHLSWLSKERTLIKRQKLELLVESLQQVEEYLLSRRFPRVYEKAGTILRDPIPTITLIARFHFPELVDPINALRGKVLGVRDLLLNFQEREFERSQSRKDDAADEQETSALFKDRMPSILKDIYDLTGKCALINQQLFEEIPETGSSNTEGDRAERTRT